MVESSQDQPPLEFSSDEYAALSTAITAVEEYMVKLAQDVATLTSRLNELEEGV